MSCNLKQASYALILLPLNITDMLKIVKYAIHISGSEMEQ
jgi:hypothetical protein